MKHPDSKDNAKAPGPRPSAIERQMTAVSRLGYDEQTPEEAEGRAIDRREAYFYANRRKHRRIGSMGYLVLFLVVVIGVAWVFVEISRPAQNTVGGAVQRDEPPAAIPNTPPASTPQAVVPDKVPDKVVEVATPAAISVPIADISLRSRPELVEQLVQVYRSQLVANPNDAAALAALNRLQERSLADMETIAATEGDSTAAKSLELVSRLFPELVDNPRYKSLLPRTAPVQAKSEPAPKPQQAAPITTAVVPPAVSPAKSVASSKPNIRVVSVTPGTMIEQRFVPAEEGTAFMVEISYRNFKISDDQAEINLVALLGVPGDPTVLSEASVDISGDRGTKSFLMEALIPGVTGERYRLNFMLNGEFLASSTVRLSVPRQ